MTPLLEVLNRSRELGFLGPGPVEPHVDHAERLLPVIDRLAPGSEPMLDLGSGGGVPGLVLAFHLPAPWVLLDASLRRTEFLREAVEQLGMAGRVSVVRARAEIAGRDPELRGRFAVVTARSFGPPAATAECGAAFLAPDGCLLVSEPPEPDDRRWPQSGLESLGLRWEGAESWAVLRQVRPLADRFPRREGQPSKHPLW